MSLPRIINCELTALGANAIAINVVNKADLIDNVLDGEIYDLSVNNASTAYVEGNIYDTINLIGTGAIVPFAGDRSTWDALNYDTRHANDIDNSSGIHHTLGTGADQAAAGNHTHTVSPGSISLTNTHILVGNGSNIAADVAMSNDATLANTGALTLATVNSNVGTFGSETQVTQITVNAKGLVTSASNVTINASPINVYNETQSGLGGGVTIYYLYNVATANTVRAYVNGIRQPVEDSVTDSDAVTFITAPALGDTLLFDYELETA